METTTLPPAPPLPTTKSTIASMTGLPSELRYIQYQHSLESQYLPAIRALISKDLSEPYSIYVYRYFLYQWAHLCFMVRTNRNRKTREGGGMVRCFRRKAHAWVKRERKTRSEAGDEFSFISPATLANPRRVWRAHIYRP